MSQWKVGWVLFWSYIRITSLVLGGGYAIIAAAQEEFVHRRGWLTEEDVLEMITVTQTVPGILACNSAVYVGWKLGGLPGAVAALAGAVLPSLVIIVAIAASISRVQNAIMHPTVRGAFIGLISCIVGMVFATALRMWKKVMHSKLAYFITAGCLIGLSVFKCHPAVLIAGAVVLGVTAELAERLLSRGGRSS
jgi:chromate transporter